MCFFAVPRFFNTSVTSHLLLMAFGAIATERRARIKIAGTGWERDKLHGGSGQRGKGVVLR